MAGLVDAATVHRMAGEPSRPMSWRPGGDVSVADVVGDRFGPQVVERSVNPMLAGVYAGSAATIGMRAAVPTVAAALDRGAPSLTDAVRAALPPSTAGPVFGAIEGGYRVLLDALVARSGLRWQGTAVRELARDGAGWNLRDDEGANWHADAVILALPAPRLAGLVAAVAPRTAAAAGKIATASSVVLALAVPGGTPLPQHSGVLVASGERLHAKAITLTTRKWGARGNAELLRLSFGRFGDTIARDTSDDTLLAWSPAGSGRRVRHQRRTRRRARAPLAGRDAAVRPGSRRTGRGVAGRAAALPGRRGQLPRRYRGAGMRGCRGRAVDTVTVKR